MNINDIAIAAVGLVLGALALIYVRLNPTPPFELREECQGRAWRRRFPVATSDEIRHFLLLFTESFDFYSSAGLRFSPDDGVLEIYRKIYPSRWTPDQMELETFAKELLKEFDFELRDVWSERLTLGELFALVRASAEHDV